MLREIVFLKSWRSYVMTDFMGRCNQMFERCDITCPKCSRPVEQTYPYSWFPLEGEFYGLQSYTCYNCMKHFCHECTNEENGEDVLLYCKICEKEYCTECASMETCAECNDAYCNECKSMVECGECNNNFCSNCIAKCGRFQCNENVCNSCADERSCNDCNILLCCACWASTVGVAIAGVVRTVVRTTAAMMQTEYLGRGH